MHLRSHMKDSITPTAIVNVEEYLQTSSFDIAFESCALRLWRQTAALALVKWRYVLQSLGFGLPTPLIGKRMSTIFSVRFDSGGQQADACLTLAQSCIARTKGS